MTSDATQPDSEPGSIRGGSDEPLDRKRREAVDETETAEPRATPLPAHVAIEGYEIIRELHRGGQGIVYEAVQKSTRRKVAIKILLEGRFASSSARRRFQREITLAAGLKHPNIIAIFDSGETPDGHQFCVMDYVRGRSIRDYVRRNKLPLEDTLELFSLVCEAAHFANQKGVVHRDLKPSNILVDTDGVPRVLDFGLAKQLAGGTQSLVSITGQVMGTLQYMSPEQTRGNPDEIDARSDVYSLGVVLYELLTGTHPYPVEGDMLEIVKHITETEPELPSKVWTADSGVSERKSRRFRVGQCPIDNELQTILFKALSKNRQRRYQSAEALRQDIISYLAGDPIEAKRDSSLYVLKKSLRRHRTRIAVMAGFVVVAALALYVGSRTGTREAPALALTGPITSLAVLPLENLSGDPEQEYFADGMTGELITALGKIKALKVTARISVMKYKDTDLSLTAIAHELNVDAIVEGTVARSDDRVRITASLVRAATSEQLWGDSYERDMRNILAMQADIARSIAREIKIAVSPEEESRFASARPVNPDAYEAYLLGDHYRRKLNTLGREKALRYFEQAIAKDPAYAPAYAGLASSYTFLGFFGHLPRQEAFPKARQLATRALELDDTLADAHRILGLNAFYYDWDWVEAERSLRRAIELSPSDARPHIAYAWYLLAMRRLDEGIAEAQRARELDPLSLTANLAYGQALYMARRFDDAMLQFRACVELEPNDPWAHSYLARLHEREGQFDLAASEHEKDMRYSGRELEEIAAFSGAYAAGGWELAQRWTIDNLEAKAGSEHGPALSLSLPMAYAKLGEQDKAFEWLEKAYERRNSSLPYLAVNPAFDSLHGDPRFDDLLRRIGLEPESKSRAAVEPPAGGKIMLAVLPFDDMSPDPQEWFSDGMTEEMIARLGRMQPKKLGVIARTSAMRYKNTTKGIDRIGRELNVEYILEGSVLRIGERVRITAQLIQVSDQTHLWADSYERDMRDILAMQGEIARAIAGEIQVKLTPEEAVRLAPAYPVNPQAHEAYLKGRYHWNKWTHEGFKKAVDYYQDAIEIDGTFALAYMGLSAAYNTLGFFGALPPADAFLKSKEAVLRALDIDQTLGEAHAVQGMNYLVYEWDFSAAEQAFKRAVQFSPNNPTVHHAYMVYLERMGRMDEALEEIKRARELDPLSLIIIVEIGEMLYLTRRYDAAIEYFNETISLDPNFVTAHVGVGLAYLQKRKYDQAITELEKATRLSGRKSLSALSKLGYAYAASGRTTEARRLLEELNERSTQEYVSPYTKATIYIGLGEKDEAFAWLERAYEERAGLVSFKTDPLFDPLRDDPRFDDLLRRIGLQPTRAAGEMKSRLIGSPRGLTIGESPPADGKIMLAVLAFQNLGSPDDEYFADGISDEIRSRLAAVRKLGVISRSSAFQYKDSDKTNRQIGSELGVDYLIDGTIRWDKRGGGAGRVRITPELIRISDDMSLWSQSYNREFEDIFEVQSDIAGQVIKQLRITLLEPERQAIEAKPTENHDAYRAYLRGLDYAGRPDYAEEDLRLAIQMFERAVKLDPDFALAYSALSTAHSGMHHFGYDRTQGRTTKAKVVVDRALELQPQLPDAHLALGYYHYWCYRDYDRSLEALAIAEKDLPNDASILEIVGYVRRRQGRLEEALANLKRAFELSPIDANLAANIAETYILLRRYSDGVYWCDRSISLAPDQVFAYVEKARNHWLWHGEIENARSTLEEMPSKNTSRSIFHWFQQELFEKKYQAALDRLAFRPGESLEYQFWFIPKSQLAGLVHQLMGESERSREAYETARILLEEEIEKRAEDHRVRSSLGIVYAGLARKEDAIREGKRGVELFPVSKDALIGPYRVENLAFIYTLVGDYDAALDRLEYLLSIPSETMSVPMLRLDPRWDPLRSHPRYKAIMRRHGFEPESKSQATEPRDAKPPDDPMDSGGGN